MSLARFAPLVCAAVGVCAACGAAPHPLGSSERARSSAPSSLTAPAAAAAPCESLEGEHPIPVDPGRGDRVVLANDGDRALAYVADEDERAIHTIDLGAAREIAVTPLRGAPSALVATKDGRLVAALRDRNEIVVLEPRRDPGTPLALRCAAPVASEPVGLGVVESPDAPERVVVASGYGHALTALGARDLGRVFQVDLPRDPRAVLVRGDRVYVSHMTSSELSVVDATTGTRAPLDLLGGRLPRGASLGPSSTGLDHRLHGGQSFSLASADGRLFAPMVTVDPGEPKITGAYGSTEVPVKPFVGVVDVAQASALTIDVESQTSPSNRACMLPRAAAALPGGRLFVTCAGIDELLEVDGRADDALHALRRRVRVPRGPLGLAVDAHRAVVWSAFAREVSIVPVAAPGEVARVAVSRRAVPIDEAFERGREIFHDSFDLRVSSDGRACASCHPDGRDDGNTWSTPDGPRQTISLAGRVDGSGPYGWFGKHPTLDSHLADTMKRLGGSGFAKKADRADLDALEAYLMKMKAPVARRDPDDRRERGKALFYDAQQGCGACHEGGASDHGSHDVGSGHAEEASLRFDTPSLAFVASSAPYFHDGRYATLDDLLAKGDDRMGHTKHLDADERAELVAYMQSIAPTPEAPALDAPFAEGGALTPLSPDATSAAERAALASSPPPLVYEGLPIDGDAIPVYALDAPVPWDAKRAEAPGEPLPEGELAWKDGCVAVAHHAAATLRLDWRTASMTDALERCVYAPDATGYAHWTDGSSISIDPQPDGRLRVVERDLAVRLAGHEIRIVRTLEADAVPIVPGLVYAFRTRSSDPERPDEQLHVVWPSDADSIFTVTTSSLAPGRSGHVGAVVAPWSLAGWNRATGSHVETGSRIGAPRSVVLRLDVTRLVSESAPQIALGRSACTPEVFGSCP